MYELARGESLFLWDPESEGPGLHSSGRAALRDIAVKKISDFFWESEMYFTGGTTFKIICYLSGGWTDG